MNKQSEVARLLSVLQQRQEAMEYIFNDPILQLFMSVPIGETMKYMKVTCCGKMRMDCTCAGSKFEDRLREILK